jgi:hypothetical protein
MISVAELRIGNLLIWDPSIAHPGSTLSPLVVEVAAILPTQVGYVPANIALRVEPFEDDLLQQEPVFRDATEFEPLPMTAEMMQAFSQQSISSELSPFINDKVAFVHQYQNLFFLLTGEEADTNVIQDSLVINRPGFSV